MPLHRRIQRLGQSIAGSIWVSTGSQISTVSRAVQVKNVVKVNVSVPTLSIAQFLLEIIRAFRSVVDRLLCMLKVKGSNPLMSTLFLNIVLSSYARTAVATAIKLRAFL